MTRNNFETVFSPNGVLLALVACGGIMLLMYSLVKAERFAADLVILALTVPVLFLLGRQVRRFLSSAAADSPGGES